jgi:hypothetical protein
MADVRTVEIRAAVAGTAEDLLNQAVKDLGVYGGQAYGLSRDDDLTVSLSFDPRTAKDGASGILTWLESLGVEFSAEFIAWEDE